VNRIQRKITPAVFGTCFPALRQGYDNEKKDKARTYHEFVVDVLTHLPTARPATGQEYIDGEEDKKKKQGDIEGDLCAHQLQVMVVRATINTTLTFEFWRLCQTWPWLYLLSIKTRLKKKTLGSFWNHVTRASEEKKNYDQDIDVPRHCRD